MSANGYRAPADNLDAAQCEITLIGQRIDAGAYIKPELALQIALARTLLDIARSLRSLEGYLCNPSPRAAR